jgi:PAS domain S-box-containing protein
MFRVKESDFHVGFSAVAAVALVVQALALAAMLGSFLLVVDQFWQLGPIASANGSAAAAATRALRGVMRLQLALTSIFALAQLVGLIAFLRLRRSQLAGQRSIQRVKQLAHNILASLDQGVITTDAAGTVTSINTAANNLLGIDVDCVGGPVAGISSPAVPLADLQRDARQRTGAGHDREFTIVRDGRARRLVVNVLDLKDAEATSLGYVIHLRDVTERVLMKEQVWRMEQFASLSTLATGLHHEIKNPLTALSLHVELMEERLGPSADLADMLGVVKAEVRRLSAILESFRDFASLERLAVRHVDVIAVLENVVRLMRPQAAQQAVVLELEPARGPLPRADLDAEKLEQAVLNLVLNSLDAMPNGGRLTVSAGVDEARLRVVVRDTGPGIPPDVQDHIFRPYFSTKERGIGMGLALVEKLVRQHQGDVNFQTGPAGTAFRINLPLNGPASEAAR